MILLLPHLVLAHITYTPDIRLLNRALAHDASPRLRFFLNDCHSYKLTVNLLITNQLITKQLHNYGKKYAFASPEDLNLLDASIIFKRGANMFNKIFGKRVDEEPKIEEFTEVPHDESQKKINIMVEKLEGLADADPIIKKVKEGHIVLAHIKGLRETNMEELKQSIGKIRTYTANMKGDVVGVGDEWLVVAPASVEIKRN